MFRHLQKIAVTTLMTLAVVLPVNTVMADQLKDILDKGTIKIGVPENFPPFGSVGKDFNGSKPSTR